MFVHIKAFSPLLERQNNKMMQNARSRSKVLLGTFFSQEGLVGWAIPK